MDDPATTGTDDPTTHVSRRGFLVLATGTTAVGGGTNVAAAQESENGTATAAGGAANGTGGDTGNATGETGNQTGNGTENGGGNVTGDGTQAGGTTHTVAMTDELVYEPAEITVAPGDTVVWENVGSIGHTVTAYGEEIPDEAEYFASGGFDSEDAARSAYAPGDPDSGDIGGGETYEHTFSVLGDYGYFCIPHESVGMVGTVTVSEGGGQAAQGGGATGPQVPGAVRTLAIALTGGMLATLSLVYLFVKFGGNYSFEEVGEDR